MALLIHSEPMSETTAPRLPAMPPQEPPCMQRFPKQLCCQNQKFAQLHPQISEIKYLHKLHSTLAALSYDKQHYREKVLTLSDTGGKIRLFLAIIRQKAGIEKNFCLFSTLIKLYPVSLMFLYRNLPGSRRENTLVCRQWNRTANNSTCCLHCSNDLFSRLVYQVVIVRFQFNSNFLTH